MADRKIIAERNEGQITSSRVTAAPYGTFSRPMVFRSVPNQISLAGA